MASSIWKFKGSLNFLSYIQNMSPYILSRCLRPLHLKRFFESASVYNNIDVIEFLNSSSPDTLLQYHLSPLLVQDIINMRVIKNVDIDDLPTLGINKVRSHLLNKIINDKENSVEELQSIIESRLSHLESQLGLTCDRGMIISDKDGDSTYKTLQKKKSNFKRCIYMYPLPDIKNYDFQKVSLITGASMSLNHLCITTINVKGFIENMKIIPLFTDLNDRNKILGLHDMCEKVLTAVQELPESDLLIFEKIFSPKNSFDTRHLSMMQNMIIPITTKWRQVKDKHSTILLQRSLVSKLYDLEIDRNQSERKSYLDIGERILIGERPFKWMTPLSFSSSALKTYILTKKIERLHLIESLLIAIAFNSVYVKNVFGNYLVSEDIL